MSQFVFKMPDLGEGTVEAEIVAWHTAPGATVTEDQVIVEVMTDKAAVEVPAPVSGRVLSITGAPGDKVAVGSPLIVFETDAADAAAGAAPARQRGGGGAAAQSPRVLPPAATECRRRRPHRRPRRGIRPDHGLPGQSAASARGGHRPYDTSPARDRAAASCATIWSRPARRPAAAAPGRPRPPRDRPPRKPRKSRSSACAG